MLLQHELINSALRGCPQEADWDPFVRDSTRRMVEAARLENHVRVPVPRAALASGSACKLASTWVVSSTA
jgi:hypothetical protein